MYRPQSQASRRQKSNDIRDLQTKTKNLSSKQRKQYVKRLLQNAPNHIDSDRRLIIQSHTNRNQLRQRVQKKTSQEDKQMWRSGVIRFIKPRLSDRDYKRCKRLFQIFTKIQKCKHEVMGINVSSMKYIKQGMSLHQNQRLKELNEIYYKLQAEEETLLLQIQNQSKENKLYHAFSDDKNQITAKQSHLMQRDRNPLTQHKPTQNTQNVLIQHVSSSIHKRKQSSLSKKAPDTPSNIEPNSSHLIELFQLVWSLDEGLKEKIPDKASVVKNHDIMLKCIKDLIRTKFDVIGYLFTTMANLCKNSKKDFANQTTTIQKEQNHKDSQQKHQHNLQQSMKSPKSYQTYNKVFKSSTIKNLSKNFNEIEQSNINSPNTQDSQVKNSGGTRGSFKKMFEQLQKYLKEINHLKTVNQRNNDLAKQLLFVSGQLNQQKNNKQQVEKQKQSLEKRLNSQKQQQNVSNMLKKDNELLNRRNQKLDQDNTKLLNQIHKMKNEINAMTQYKENLQKQLEKSQKQAKQSQKFQKYYRQALSLEKQLKILSEQNQKISHQLKHLKEQYDQLVINTTKKQDQITQIKPSNPQQAIKKDQVQSSHQKSIKQSSNTSLIYKQLQKNNKKLSDQNKKLQESNKQLSDQIRKLIDQNIKISDQHQKISNQHHNLSEENHKMSEMNFKITQLIEKMGQESKRLKEEKSQQMVFLQKQNEILLEENKRISEQNKKIEEEFEYIVKQKLQLESTLNQKTKEKATLLKAKEEMIHNMKLGLVDLEQNMIQLKENRDLLIRDINVLKESVKEMFQCIDQEMTSAFAIFVNEFSSKLYLQQENSKINKNSCSKRVVHVDPQVLSGNEQQGKEQKIDQNLSSIGTDDRCQQEIMRLRQQYQGLDEELNHCLYELSTYKSMLGQVQIQKQLQKKYFEEDIVQLKLKLSLVEKQYTQLKFQTGRVKAEMNNSRKDERMDIRKMKDESAQTLPLSEKHKITSNLVSVNHLTSNSQSIRPTQLSLQSHIISQCYSVYVPIPKWNRFKINCELFSVTISPVNLSTIVVPSQYCDEQQEQEMIAFDQWLSQVKLDSETSTQLFKSFCSVNLDSGSSPHNPLLVNQLQNQNKQLKLQKQKLKQDKILNSSLPQSRSPLKDILSPNQKLYTYIQNKEEEAEQAQINVIGSLYNCFLFPQIQRLQSKENDLMQTSHDINFSQQSYLPLQKIKKSQAKVLPSVQGQIEKPAGQSQIKFPSNHQEDDQSFDLCII